MKDIMFNFRIIVSAYCHNEASSYCCICVSRIYFVFAVSIRALVLLWTPSQGRRLFLAAPHPTTASRVPLRSTEYPVPTTEYVLCTVQYGVHVHQDCNDLRTKLYCTE